MLQIHKINPMVRAVAVIGVVTAVVTSVTFATLTNQVVLADSQVAAGAGLLIKSGDAGEFGTSAAGTTFSGITPGGTPRPVAGFGFQLKNATDGALSVHVAVPNSPVFTPAEDPVNLSKVHLIIQCGTSPAFDRTLTQLHSAEGVVIPGLTLPVSTGAVNCTAKMSMETGTFNGANVASSDLDINFIGDTDPAPSL
ncbi:MAG TPA: hypothetical protein VMY99_05550 [Nevskiaceae bacterium]|nr:hypothetical protein [Nevskiaceae bacterium]